jgi:hypothetical protein
VLAVARLTLQLLLPFLEAGRAIYADLRAVLVRDDNHGAPARREPTPAVAVAAPPFVDAVPAL